MEHEPRWFVLLDGDDVGNRMENLLLKNRLDDFIKASQAVTVSVEEIARTAASINGAEVLTAGGDSILIGIPEDQLKRLLNALEDLQGKLGFSFSAGYGKTLRAAHTGLRLAKTEGKSRIGCAED